MGLSQESVTKNIDELIAASEQFEEQLTEAGVNQAHDWMFHIREVLYDLRRINTLLADLFNSADIVNQAPISLQTLVATILYEVVPHVQYHLNELEKDLDSFFPESETPDEDNNGKNAL